MSSHTLEVILKHWIDGFPGNEEKVLTLPFDAQTFCAELDEDRAAMINAIEIQGDEIMRLRSALEFYANPVVYQPDSTGRCSDLTVHAKDALEI